MLFILAEKLAEAQVFLSSLFQLVIFVFEEVAQTRDLPFKISNLLFHVSPYVVVAAVWARERPVNPLRMLPLHLAGLGYGLGFVFNFFLPVLEPPTPF